MNNKKHVSVFLPAMSAGGAETVAANLCNNLVKYYHVHLVIVAGEVSFNIDPLVNITRLYKKPVGNNLIQKISIPLQAYKYYRFCKKNNISSSLSFLPQANFVNAFGKFFGAKYKIILSQRTNESAYINMLSPVKKMVQRFFVKFLYRRADIINANSFHSLKDLQDNFALKQATSVIYNPLSPLPKNFVLPKEMENTDSKFKLLYVGNFRKEKNHEILLQAVLLLPFKSNVKLFLIGGGNSEKEQAFIDKNDLNGVVEILGFIDKPFHYINAVDCCILSSDFEGFSNFLLEALACGKPVISTATHGGIEMLNPDDADITIDTPYKAAYGILTKIGDAEQMKNAISLLYNDPKLSVEYTAKAFERATHFNAALITEKFVELMEA